MKLSTQILHCFGTQNGIKVSPREAANMIQASGIREIPINTHNIDHVKHWKDLNIGYGTASWNTISDFLDMDDYTPIWNINLPQTVDDAVYRTMKTIELGGDRPIKFEVLDASLSWSCNSAVLRAVNTLVNREHLEVWPLIAPNINDFMALQDLGCTMIRLMGSPISSNKGILKENITTIKQILASKKCLAMLDGGVNSIATIKNALNMGFDAVLVNSWLFSNENNPAAVLKSIKEAIDE